MDFLMLLKSGTSTTTKHLVFSLAHLPPDEITQQSLVVQAYSPKENEICREWLSTFYSRAREEDVETDTRRVLNYMIGLSESDRIYFRIVGGVLSAIYGTGLYLAEATLIVKGEIQFILTDLQAAALLTFQDEGG